MLDMGQSKWVDIHLLGMRGGCEPAGSSSMSSL